MSYRNSQNGESASGFLISLVASTFLMGSSFVVGKILLLQGFQPMMLISRRFLVAALATLPLALFSARNVRHAVFPRHATLRDYGNVAMIGALQIGAVMGLLFLSMRSIPPATAAILEFTVPIWIAILGRFFLRERLPASRIVGLLLGLAGVVLAIGVSGSTSGGTLRAELMAVASALCWAAATIISKRVTLPFRGWTLSFWQMITGALVLFLIAYGLGERWPDHTTPQQYGWFLWLAIPASTGSFGLWFIALAKGGATRASSYLFLAPLFAVLVSFFVLGTTLIWQQLLGGIFIGTAIWLINRTPVSGSAEQRENEAIAQGQA
jgi:drug/metabolite transporter (DMT)-like permease